MFDFLRSKPAYTNLKPAEFAEAIQQQPRPTVLDVRTPGEFAGGHLPGAINVDSSSRDFEQRVARYAKEAPLYLYCRSGMRSGNAASLLTRLGYTQVHNLKGGLLDWTGPLTTKK